MRSRTSLALLALTWLCAAASAQAQAPAAPPPVVAPPPAAYPSPAAYPQQAYPQQAYPQQAYPQQAYPQQAYPQQAYPQQAYPQQAYPPQYAPAAAPRRARPRISRGLMIAGIAVLSASYGVAVITGSSLIDSDCCSRVGSLLLIPVAGPYLAAGAADNGKGLLTLLGTVEVVGAGLLIGGIVRYVRSKNAAQAQGYYTWQLPHERSLGLAMSTSPALLGPRLRLRF